MPKMARSRAKKGGQAPVKSGKEPATSVDGGGASEEAATTATAVLSPELMAELGDSSTGGALISNKASSKGKKRGRVVSSETRELAANISKSKAKKLKQLEDKKAKDGRRAELYLKLEQNRMSQNQLALLQSSKTISMNQDTLRSRIKHAVQRAVAGIALSDDAVNELESHPGAVADVEEALSLPVGGALAAARRNNGSSAEPGKGGDPETVGRQEAGAGKVAAAAKAVGSSGSGNAKAGGGGASAKGVAAAAASTGEKAAADASASKKRGAFAATVPVASRTPKRRIQVVPQKTSKTSKPPKMSADNTRDSESGGSGDSSSDDELENGAEASRSGVAATSGEKPDAPTPAPPAVAAAKTTVQAGETETEPAATSGSSWAAKMMSSMARLPTSGSTSQWGALASSSEAGTNSTVAAEATDATGATKDGGDDEGGVNQNDVDDKQHSGAEAASAPAVPSYPPPPSWLEGKAPVYRAVETPLPSTSGETSYRSTANGHGRGSGGGSASLFPRPKRWVPVKRSVALQAARMQLPVCGMEQEIMEAVHDNDTVILCGETGSGKSTQVPQFLYEAGYAAHGLIGVTQPRRVAAVGTAERVAVELGTRCGRGGAVAYQIRYDASGVGPKTRVKFMTDGVLLQEITSDLLLRKYSVVLLDEAHERNLNTDVLLGMLSRSIPLR